MESKLLERLREIEAKSPIETDEGLIAALEHIIEIEEGLPQKARDYDLIEEAIEFKLQLEGVDTEACGRRANELAKRFLRKHTKKNKTTVKRHTGLRRLVGILAAALALAVLTISIYAFSPSFRDFTNRMYNQLKDKTWYQDGNTDYIITHDITEFKSLDELASDSRFSSLALPYHLPDEYAITGIRASDFGEFQMIDIDIRKGEQNCAVRISVPSSEDYREYETVTIGDYDVIITEDGDGLNGMFKTGNDAVYKVTADSMESLKGIIQGLRNR